MHSSRKHHRLSRPEKHGTSYRKVVLRKGAEMIVFPDQRDARSDLRDLLSRRAELRRDLLSEQANADVRRAEAALEQIRSAATEALLMSDDPSVHANYRARHRAALADVESARAAERRFFEIQAEAREADAEITAVVRAIVEREALRLAQVFHDHEQRALQAHAAVEGLIEWAWGRGEGELAQRLRTALQTFPANTPEDPGRLDRAKKDLDRRLARFRDGWKAAAHALTEDPHATGPNPEEIGREVQA